MKSTFCNSNPIHKKKHNYLPYVFYLKLATHFEEKGLFFYLVSTFLLVCYGVESEHPPHARVQIQAI